MEYIQARMQELGVKCYSVRWRHMQIPVGMVLPLEAEGDLVILVTDQNFPLNVKIESEYGHFEMSDPALEQHHEFRGKIKITNKSSIIQSLQFIQVSPKRIQK